MDIERYFTGDLKKWWDTNVSGKENFEEFVNKIINESSFELRVSIFFMIITFYSQRKREEPSWGRSILRLVSKRSSDKRVEVESPEEFISIKKTFEQHISPTELELRKFLYLLNKRDPKFYSEMFSLYEKKIKKSGCLGLLLVVFISIIFI